MRSRESVLIQLSDVLTGAVSAKLNESIDKTNAKSLVISRIESRIGKAIRHTLRNENKFNVFVIDLQGGW